MFPVPSVSIIHLICMITIISWLRKVSSENSFVPESHKNWNNLDHQHCGFSHSKRIIGGKDAKLGEYPWLVLIGHEAYEGVAFSCGGAILNPHYVLTAEHCVYCEDCGDSFEPPNVIRGGEHNLKTTTDCSEDECAPPAQERGVKKIFRIEGQGIWPHNDIGLIQVDEPFEFNGFVLPVCLPTSQIMATKLTGKTGVIAGWGATANHVKKISMKLQKLRVKILSQEACAKFYTEFNKTTQICADGKSDTGACNGDSGGPLFMKALIEDKAKYVVVGVVSYGPKFCATGPTVYTNININLKWILDNITLK